MVDSDSDAGFDEEIPINSNHERINLDLESQWNSNRSKHGHHHRRGGKSGKHHPNRTKTGFSYHDTNEYFELARQARLLNGKGDENTINDPGKHAVPDRGKGIVDHGTGGSHSQSQVNGSRFQWSKPFRNRKNKLVRNGCISPENVLRVNGSRHNAGGPSVEQVVGIVDDKGKGKGKLGLSDSSGTHKSEAGVMLHEHRETRSCSLS